MPSDFITDEELDAAMDHIMAAPKDDAPIASLCFREGFNQRAFPDHLVMTPEEGVIGERWLKHPWLKLEDGSPDPRIQVSILGTRVWETVVGDKLHPGDTIIADMDMSRKNLPVGQLLQVGEVTLRVSDVFNDGCVKWKVRYGTPAKDWITRKRHIPLRLRGILCEIVTGGTVRMTDRIRKV